MSTDMREAFVIEHMSKRAPILFVSACLFLGAAIFSAVTDHVLVLRSIVVLMTVAAGITLACVSSEIARRERAAALSKWDDLAKTLRRPPPPSPPPGKRTCRCGSPPAGGTA